MYPRIKDLREDAGISQDEMARRLNISQATYSRYETGILDIPTKSLIDIADHYHVSVDYLLGRTKNPAIHQ